ncbi:MAG: riboflavin biosynthesis protein RibF [Opitutales bacterium]
MSTCRQFGGLADAGLPAGPVHLALGMFDGVHRGHQSVVASAVRAARATGGLAGVLTFWPHPSAVLRPDHPVRLLLPRGARTLLLAGLGLDFLIEEPFTPELARTTSREFVARLKQSLPGLAAVYVGENFHFGRGREGDAAFLAAQAAAAGFTAHPAPRLQVDGAPVSSSRLRELVARGDIEQANVLLGYSYFSSGVVEPGRQLGRTLGFPTLNLRWEPALLPAYGVYVVEVTEPSGRCVPGVANYGLRPTVEQADRPLLEVHVLGETGLTAGDAVTVRWLRFLRPERKFAGLGELRAQIGQDRENALAALPELTARNFPRG